MLRCEIPTYQEKMLRCEISCVFLDWVQCTVFNFVCFSFSLFLFFLNFDSMNRMFLGIFSWDESLSNVIDRGNVAVLWRFCMHWKLCRYVLRDRSRVFLINTFVNRLSCHVVLVSEIKPNILFVKQLHSLLNFEKN